MASKRMTADEVAAQIGDGMTVGIGGWGSRRKPMSIVRALLRSDVKDLTVVSYGGPDVGLLCRAGKVRKVVYGFVTLDSIPLDPNFRAVREAGGVDVDEYDEGMILAGLKAAAQRLPFLPIRAGLGSDVLAANPHLRTVQSPYDDDRVVAMPPLRLDVALVHLNAADERGNGQYLGPDPLFDDLYCMAADKAFVSCERIVDTAALLKEAPVQSLLVSRMYVSGVVESPRGAHFTSCAGDYERDEAFQRHYVASARDPGRWQDFHDTFLSGDEAAYQTAVDAFHGGRGGEGVAR
jgi:acyl CoA:acetate/3-ketoacid CoA transferase alpha subunit